MAGILAAWKRDRDQGLDALMLAPKGGTDAGPTVRLDPAVSAASTCGSRSNLQQPPSRPVCMQQPTLPRSPA